MESGEQKANFARGLHSSQLTYVLGIRYCSKEWCPAQTDGRMWGQVETQPPSRCTVPVRSIKVLRRKTAAMAAAGMSPKETLPSLTRVRGPTGLPSL